MDAEELQFLQMLADNLQSSANVKAVFGEPVEFEGKTVIPVARIAYGLGGGYGKIKGSNRNESAGSPQLGEGGGGGGLAAFPVGVVEITKKETRFIPTRNKRISLIGAFLAGFVAARLLSRRKETREASNDQLRSASIQA